ncbi:MAG TPA: crossover junction endodeoxyribonuclease RuvC [Thermoanaerobaculia bacterium]|nr:crossover junction endodeoxyribonuclease RuvC [Thermoanaerobaculia bacterium]HUM28901.1 crossover junction endodeoxyribonuclease RuvC [Thermoanaerobaculia bacterium]HXK67166.1 crossover junction endodeoxyribonuclease RuvC [Thermoanaerobaculia bacterium]
MSGSTRILSTDITIVGIDPGSRLLGLAAIRVHGGKPEALDGTLLKVRGESPGQKLQSIYDTVGAYLETWNPHQGALEDLFSKPNVHTTVVLARVSGIILLRFSQADLPLTLYPPARVKSAITGYGNASKDQIRYVVVKTLGLPEDIPEDVSDAYAVALSHAFLHRELS